MKKLFSISIFLFIFILTINCNAQDTWFQKADFGGLPRSGAVGFSIGDKGYIGLGGSSISGINFYKDFWEYDPSTDSWVQKADFPGSERRSAIGFSINNKGYIGLGYNGNTSSFFKDLWEYNPATDTWTQKADFPGTERSGSVAFSIDKKAYIGTGFFNIPVANYFNDFWEYNPANDTWTQKADFPGSERRSAIGFSIGTKGYIGTGFNGTPASNHLKDFWEYNSITDTWMQKADFIEARSNMIGFSIGAKGYIGTGSNENNQNHKDFWEYDTTLNYWTQLVDFDSTQRSSAVGFSIGQKGYIGAGWNLINMTNYFYKDFWEYSTVVNINDISTKIDVNIFQNSYYILSVAASVQLKEINIYDIMGRQQMLLKPMQNYADINITTLPAGTFIIKIFTLKSEISFYKFFRL